MNRILRGISLLALIAFLTGCQALSGKVPAEYTNLKDQKIAVMVWADRATLADFPSLQVDVASRVQRLLSEPGLDELEGATFPNRPQSIVKYQLDYPQYSSLPITEVAPKLGATRLIYIEIHDMRTRSRSTPDLFLGEISANVKVVEVADGKATITYMKDNLTARFPSDDTPADGLPAGNDDIMYRGVVSKFGEKVGQLFVEHEE